MATFTTILNLRKPASDDFVSRVLDVNDNWDSIDTHFNTTAGHKHTGVGTNAPRLLIEQNFEVNRETAETASLDTLDANSRLVDNLDRIRYWITQVSGQALGTVSTNLNSHVTATLPAHGISGFAVPVTVGTANAVGSSSDVPRSDHVHFHGALAAITNAHAFTDISGVITNTQHGTRTVASAHGFGQITGTISTTQHGALAAITNAHAFTDISGVITDAKHGTRTVANAHGFGQISGTISTAQHGALAAITNAHAFADMNSGISDAQHGVRTIANAHGMAQMSGTLAVSQHGALGALADSHPYTSITDLEFHAPRHVAGGADPAILGAMVLITELVVSTAVATVSFTSIPATYRHLRVVIHGRVNTDAPGTEIDVQFNGDFGANHDYIYSLMYSTNNVVMVNVLGGGAMELGTLTTDQSPADAADSTVIDILGYAQTVFQKCALSQTQQKRSNSSGQILMGVRAGWWRNTAAVNRVDFLSTGTFKIGSIFSLYGLT